MARTARTTTPVAAPSTIDDLKARFKDYPGIQAWERAYENPDGPGSVPILLTDEAPNACVSTDHQASLRIGATTCPRCKQPVRKWYVRWVNTTQQNRVSQIRGKGLIPVQLAELMHKDEIADLHDAGDGLARSGQTGHRILYKIPLDLYNGRKRAERDHRQRRAQSARALREELASEAGHKLGSEAGDAIYGGDVFLERPVTTHRSTLADEAAGGDE